MWETCMFAKTVSDTDEFHEQLSTTKDIDALLFFDLICFPSTRSARSDTVMGSKQNTSHTETCTV